MIRTDLYYQKINDLKTALKDASYSLDIENQREELSRLEKELEKEEVYTNLAKSTEYSRKAQAIRNKLERNKQYLKGVAKGRLEKTPIDMIAKYRMMIMNFEKHLESSVKRECTKCRSSFEKQVALLDSLSPLKTMARGYAVATNDKGNLVNKMGDVKSR